MTLRAFFIIDFVWRIKGLAADTIKTTVVFLIDILILAKLPEFLRADEMILGRGSVENIKSQKKHFPQIFKLLCVFIYQLLNFNSLSFRRLNVFQRIFICPRRKINVKTLRTVKSSQTIRLHKFQRMPNVGCRVN